jgi:hypothetical protein
VIGEDKLIFFSSFFFFHYFFSFSFFPLQVDALGVLPYRGGVPAGGILVDFCGRGGQVYMDVCVCE